MLAFQEGKNPSNLIEVGKGTRDLIGLQKLCRWRPRGVSRRQKGYVRMRVNDDERQFDELLD